MKKSYFLKRLLFIPITLFGIMLVNFLFVQMAPGGPVEQMMQKIESGAGVNTLGHFAGAGGGEVAGGGDSRYRGAQGLQAELKKELRWRRFTVSRSARVAGGIKKRIGKTIRI